MNEGPLHRIRRDIGSWARRPPALSPRVARTRVVKRLEKRWRPSGWRMTPAAAVTAVALLALGLLFLEPGRSPGPVPTGAPEQSGQGLLVYELRSGSKLYLALAPRRAVLPGAPDGRRENGE